MKRRARALAVAVVLAAGGGGTALLLEQQPQVATGCVCAPADGGTACLRVEPNGAARYFGAGNAFPVCDAVGSCEPCACSSVFGL